MMGSYADALETNLKGKSNLLGKIYECNDRLRKTIDAEKSDYEEYDSYISEKGFLLEELDKLEADTDDLLDQIRAKGINLADSDSEQNMRIRSLLSEVDGKAEAVRDIESKVKELTDAFFESKRNEISTTRRQVKTIQAHYSPNPMMQVDETSSFDIKN